ncbi:MAG: IgGFc-binding protein, partial [Bacteroidetes bacterium]|nr:IgGFc-binding protein [Bacteroidota bacterium]
MVLAQTDTEFWFTVPNLTMGAAPGHTGLPAYLRLITSSQAATVTISVPANTGIIPQVVNIPPQTTQSPNLTSLINQLQASPSNSYLNSGLHIVSTVPIQAYWDFSGTNNEIFTLKGRNALGKSFVIPIQSSFQNGNLITPTPVCAFDILATEDNTTITIVPSKDIVGHAAGVAFTIVLNKGQVYSAAATDKFAVNHLGGSLVTADKPIAITVKDDTVWAGVTSNLDLLGDQTVPERIIGKEYIVVKGFLPVTINDRYYVFGTVDNTSVNVDGSPAGTVNRGTSLAYTLTSATAYIQTDKPVYVLHITGFAGEMSEAVLPPLTCTGSRSLAFFRPTATQYYAMIIVPTTATGHFLLNGIATVVTSSDFFVVPGTLGQWSYALKNISTYSGSTNIISNTTDRFLFATLYQGGSGSTYGFLSDYAAFPVSLVADTGLCPGQSITLDAGNPGYTYLWQDGTIQQTLFVNTAGDYRVTVTDPGGCQIVDSTTVFFHPGGLVSWSNSLPDQCTNNSAFPLTGGTPAGGTYTGTAVVANSFNPAIAGQGAHLLTYSITDPFGCLQSATNSILVNPAPVVNMNPLSPLCLNASPVTLVGTPPGGVFSGPGVSGDQFTPAVAGAGSWTLTYIYTTLAGCSNSKNQTVTVYPPTTVTLAPVASLCVNSLPVTLSGSPSGGVYSGPGIAGNKFVPTLVGQGNWTVMYTYHDGNGCNFSASIIIVVNALPVVSIPPITPVCVNTPPFILNGIPNGGTFAGAGVTANMFYPAIAQAGTHTVTYTYADGNGCTNFTFRDIKVNLLPGVFVYPLDSVCIDDQPVVITGDPLGGTFSGTGVAGDHFYPSLAGVGTWPVTITYTDDNQCTNSYSTNITVSPLPLVTFEPPDPVCADIQSVNLIGHPTGGTYTGTGISGDAFQPSIAGPGTWTISYSWKDIYGCTNTASQDIIVYPLPAVSLSSVSAVCADAQPVTLTGTPPGGVFSGTGVSGNQFFPAIAQAGSHILSYTIVDGNGCRNVSQQNVTVYPVPLVSIDPVSPLCIDVSPFSLIGSPSGGVFTGNGMVGDVFDPVLAQLGSNNITYTFTDNNNCSANTSIQIIVNQLPVVNLAPLAAVCLDAQPVTLQGTPLGGVFSGPGVVGDQLFPSVSQAGTHVVSYSFLDANGCFSQTSQSIIVHPLPVMSLGAQGPFCVDAPPVTLDGLPAGGTYLGGGMNGDVFSPAQAGSGMWIITYSFTDGFGCVNDTNQSILVNPLPVVSLDPLPVVCADAPVIALIGLPAAGVYSGQGIIDDTIHPDLAGAGSWVITYTFTDANSCKNTAIQTIIINPLPDVQFTAIGPLCVDVQPVTLSASPTGGIFTGTGVTGDIFNPALAGPGSFPVGYSFTDGNGCTNSVVQNIVVNPLPVVNIDPVSPMCISAPPFPLVGTPAGGLFSGAGVNGDIFDPSQTQAGDHLVTYTFTDNNGCSSSITRTITVYQLPEVTLSVTSGVCIDVPGIPLGGNPAGGVYSGTGVTGNIFYPPSAGPGTWTITYTYSDANNCSNTAFRTITVYSLPVVTLDPLPAVCANGPDITLNGTPAGGNYSGGGVSGNQFLPSVAQAGEFIISYTYTDFNNCQDNAQQTVTVYPVPQPAIDPVSPVCLDVSPFALNGSPAGGVFTGNGMVGDVFDPVLAQLGSNNITYSFTDNNNCSENTSIQIIVNPLPDVNLAPLAAVCLDALPVTLQGTPFGGVFSGPGVVGDQLFPSVSQAGTHVVSYSFTDVNGCTSQASQSIIIHPLPVMSLGAQGPFCLDAPPVTLDGLPAGGTYLGGGMNGDVFSPAQAGPGMWNITYSFTDEYGCVNDTNQPILVNPLPVVSLDPLPVVCADAPAIALIGLPAAGVYSGHGVIDDTIHPDLAGAGSWVITYTFTDDNSCKNTASQTIIINPLPDVQFTAAGPLCVDIQPVTLSAS